MMLKLGFLFCLGSCLFQHAVALKFLVSAPNTFRFGVEETIGVGITDHEGSVSVNVNLRDYPGKKTIFSSRVIAVAPGSPQIIKMKVNPYNIPDLQRNDQYISVYLTVSASGYNAEQVVPITKYSGYAMIQTDKPLYLPKQNVLIRVMRLTEKMTPNSEPFTLQIKNPQGAIVRRDTNKIPDPSGITETTFEIPSVPAFGNWSVQVLYGYQLSAKSTVRFEVKEYVLPTFSVNIEPPDMILNTHDEIVGNIHASYVYGKPVDGFANLNFAIHSPSGIMIPIGSLKFLKLTSGKVSFKLRVQQDIKAKGLLWFPEIEGSKFFIEAEVVERATGNREIAVSDATLFTKSPYIINLSNSLKDFKPRVPYQLQVEVLYSNKNPVTKMMKLEISSAVAYNEKREPRVLESLFPIDTDRYGRLIFQLNTAGDDQELDITVVTKDSDLSDDNQATRRIKVFRYISPTLSYVWISAPHEGTVFRVGAQFRTIITVHPHASQNKLFYVVVSKGSIINMNETTASGGAVLSIQFSVTAEMVPSFRLIVYIIDSGQIISDSIKIDVEKECKYNNGEDFKISAHTPSGIFNPGENVKFVIRGEFDSYIGVTAVDEAVYILNKQDLLTKAKMFDEMEKQDFGNGPGGGNNPANVFRNAGLVMLTNAAVGEHGRIVGNSQSMKRKKRSLKDKVDEYTGKAATCCKFGILQGPQNMTCEERALAIEEGIGEIFNCSAAFLDCCLEALERRLEFNQNARASLTGEDDFDPSMSDVDELISVMEKNILNNVRHYFPETWISKTFKIGGNQCIGDNGTSCVFSFIAPHSITTWNVQAFAISKTTGMCVADPFRVPVFKQMFLQLYLPPTAVRGEQIELIATVYNYGQRILEVTVYMFGVQGICMGAGPGERSELRKIVVQANNATSVTFPIMPLFVGSYDLRAVAASWDGSDAIQKTLKVVHEGVRKERSLTLSLDPSGVLPNNRKKRDADDVYSVRELTDKQDKKQNVEVRIDLPAEGIPDTETCTVRIIGDNMGQVVNITLTNMERFITLPSGCVEQTASKLAPLIYSMTYLRKSGRMTASIEETGYRHMWSGYSHQLTFRKSDGSFPTYSKKKSSVWLTAFVAKVFCQADHLIKIDYDHMCGSTQWLTSQQKSDGSFSDSLAILYVGTGDLKGTVPMTAFVLISLMECEKCLSASQNTIEKAKVFLENHVPYHNAGHLAIVTYALGLTNSSKFTVANNRLKELAIYNEHDDTRHWSTSPAPSTNRAWIYTSKAAASTIETTSYAFLAQLLTDNLDYAHPIARWLNNQRSSGGFFISTQDTVVALQALSVYNIKTKIPIVEMNCQISTSAATRKKRSVHFNNENSMVLQEIEMPANGVVYVDANGTGLATLSVSLIYNAQPSNNDRNCDFKLVIEATESTEIVRPVIPSPEHTDQTILPETIVRSIFSVEELQNRFGYDFEQENDDCPDCDFDIDVVEGKKLEIVALKICVQYLDSIRQAAMSILDIGIFTGYKPIEEDLKNLTQHSEDTYVDLYEITDRSVILYLSKVPNLAPICIRFRTFKEIHVGKMQPAAVKVYEYYEPSKACTKFYTADGKSPLLQPICEGRHCFCVEGICPSCTPFKAIRNIAQELERRTALMNLICDSNDFAWKGVLKHEYTEGSLKRYEFLITHVLKEGRQQRFELENGTVTFWARSGCRCPEMTVENEYLILSNDGASRMTEDEDNVFSYWFDRDTRIYHNRLIRNIKDRKGMNLQKTINTIFEKLAIQHHGCTH